MTPTPAPTTEAAPDRRRRLGFAVVILLVIGLLAGVLPSRAASAEGGTEPYLRVVLPDDPNAVYSGSWPLRIESSHQLVGWPYSMLSATVDVNGRNLPLTWAADQAIQVATGFNGPTTAHWKIMNGAGLTIEGSATFDVDLGRPDIITWSLPDRVKVGDNVMPSVSCTPPPGTQLEGCQVLGPLDTTRPGRFETSAEIQYRDGDRTRFERGLRYYTVFPADDGSGDPEEPAGDISVEVSVLQQRYDTMAWEAVPSPDGFPAIVEGTPGRVQVAIGNGTDHPVSFTGLEVQNLTTGRSIPLPEPNMEIGPDEVRSQYIDLDTSEAWTPGGQPLTEPQRFRVTAGAQGEAEVTVVPRPVILVHGYKSNAASSWGGYQDILRTAHPNLRGYAVGDGQVPGTMNTGSEDHPFTRTNTIAENAAQEAKYIEGVRRRTGAWHVDIVAHSMGGLISRYYLQELMPEPLGDGTPMVHRLIQLGTPNRGSQLADVLLSLGAVSTSAIPLYPATLQLSTGYVDPLFNRLITSRRDVPISNLAGTHLPLVGMPQFTSLYGDAIVPAYSARWNLTDTYDAPFRAHTVMTESAADFRNYVVPRLNDTAQAASLVGGEEVVDTDGRRTATDGSDAVDRADDDGGMTTMTTILDPGDPGDEPEPPVEEPDWGLSPPAVADVRQIEVPGGGSVELTADVPEATGFGALTSDTGVRIELIDPDGQVAATSEHGAGDPFGSAGASSPAQGTWTVRLTDLRGQARPVGVALWLAGSSLTVSARVVHLEDGGVLVTAHATNGDEKVLGADVQATVTDASTGFDGSGDLHLTLVDDGTNGDEVAGDGTYSAATAPLPEGTHTVVVRSASSQGTRIAAAAMETGDPGPVDPEPVRYHLDVQTEGDGNVVVDPLLGEYEPGDTVGFLAYPHARATHLGWTVDGVEQPPGPLVLTMDADHRVVGRFSVVPPNTSPVIDLPASLSVVEGQPFTVDGSFTDPDDDRWSATIDRGDGPVPLELDGRSFRIEGTVDDDGSVPMTVAVSDGTDVTSATVVVTATNAAPVVATTGPATVTVDAGATVDLGSTFTDAGRLDTHTATIEAVSGSTRLTPTATVAGGTVSARQQFAVAGTYTVTTKVTDDDGGVGTAVRTVVVRPIVTPPPPAPATKCQQVMPVFEQLVTQQKLKPVVATTLRVNLQTACTLAQQGNRTGAAAAMVVYRLQVPVYRLLGQVNAAQATAILNQATSAEAVFRT